MKNIKGTVKMTETEDYKERFKAEYYQTKKRYDKLHRLIVRYDAGTIDIELTCPIGLLKHQKSMMGQYLYDLEVRAEIEKIEL